ncbi:hypothetical protein EYF80_013737 [Liparis tanakae]|uniref:Uncharacterized protein n=1 Tax=Liparis tanakae TaxID=230148 RepID=A0A4Z2IEU5_9TELE|nr:hypothetical protein EYF80_013737 [Liparis tanakae]
MAAAAAAAAAEGFDLQHPPLQQLRLPLLFLLQLLLLVLGDLPHLREREREREERKYISELDVIEEYKLAV